jgi:hypothetical protein
MCTAEVDFPETLLLTCEYDDVRRPRRFLDRLNQYEVKLCLAAPLNT